MLIRFLHILAALHVAASSAQIAYAQAPTQRDEKRSALLLQHLTPSIVRRPTATGPHQTGVIVSEQGHVLTVNHSSPGMTTHFVLSGGERVSATALGFSEEWMIGLYKLDDERLWVPVKFATADEIAEDAKVVNVGFVQPEFDEVPDSPRQKFELNRQRYEQKDAEYPDSPVLKPSTIVDAHPQLWFSARHEGGTPDFGTCTFTPNGELLGLVTMDSSDHYASTSVEIVRQLLPGLKDSQNLDWTRFPPK